MNYNGIIYFDTGNSHGISTTLFVSGCDNHCHNCQNPQTWDCNYGEKFTEKIEDEIIESLKNPHVKYFVLSGGDPLYKTNIERVLSLIKNVKTETDVDIIMYTGSTLNEILREDNLIKNEILNSIDYLVDGKYDENLKTEKRELRGSSNQKCYKITDSLIEDITEEYFNRGSK